MKLKFKMFELKIDDDSDIARDFSIKIQNTHKYKNNRNNNNDHKLKKS